MAITSNKIKERAYELGFVLAGVTVAEPVDGQVAGYFRDYLSEKRYAGMGYMARNAEKRVDVSKLVEGARSVICCAASYNNPEGELEDEMLYVARYARFEDYHNIIRRKLKELAEWIASDLGCRYRVFVDTAPLLEKYYAAKAGLGWIGKNTLLINKDYGSRLLLGEVVVDVELDYDEPVDEGCGDCELCLRACPGGALLEGGKLDSNKCLSYQTIESSEKIPEDLAKKVGKRVFGCDSCQDVCPYNANAKLNVDPEFKDKFSGINKIELVNMSVDEFKSRFGDTPLSRAGLEKLRATYQSASKLF